VVSNIFVTEEGRRRKAEEGGKKVEEGRRGGRRRADEGGRKVEGQRRTKGEDLNLTPFHRTGMIERLLREAHNITSLLSEQRIILLESGGPENFEVDCILSSLVQLMADSHYYTIKGFCYLIDKEWFSYGYVFFFGKYGLRKIPEISLNSFSNFGFGKFWDFFHPAQVVSASGV
jgi:hypothetical protein